MTKESDVYVLPDDDILETLRRDMEGKEKPAPAGVRPRPARPEGRVPAGPAAAPQTARRGVASPPLAATLSIFVCGAGQVYNREMKLGAALFLTEVFLIVAHWSAAQLWSLLRDMAALFEIRDTHLLLGALAADLVAGLFLLWGVYQAYRRAEDESAPFDGLDVPIVPGVASLFVPGWGQILNGQIVKAIVFLLALPIGGIALAVLTLPLFRDLAGMPFPGGLIPVTMDAAARIMLGATALIWLLSVYDAFLVSDFQRKTR